MSRMHMLQPPFRTIGVTVLRRLFNNSQMFFDGLGNGVLNLFPELRKPQAVSRKCWIGNANGSTSLIGRNAFGDEFYQCPPDLGRELTGSTAPGSGYHGLGA